MADTSNDQHPLPTESHQPPQQDTSEDMTILGHLTELRKRILYSLLAVAIGAAAAFNSVFRRYMQLIIFWMRLWPFFWSQLASFIICSLPRLSLSM